MNEVTQRMFSAGALTLILHSALLAWHPQRSELTPAPQKITVSLRLPQPLPPPPPKKIIHAQMPTLPVVSPVAHLPPAQGKIVRTLRRLLPVAQPGLKPMPPLPPAQRRVAERLRPAPALALAAVPPPLSALPSLPEQGAYAGRADAAAIPVQPVQGAVSRAASSVSDDQEAAPLYASNPPPEYPAQARRRGLQGVAVIEAFIDLGGRVADLRLSASSGHSSLDAAALKAVRGWRFQPGTAGGRRQQMWVKVPVRFELR